MSELNEAKEPKNEKQPLYPTKVSDKAKCLPGTQENDPCQVRLVGDSTIRGQLNAFCIRDKKNRQRFCYPGAKIKTLIDSLDTFTANDTDNTHYILHVGTNDISGPQRNPELIANYKKLLLKLKEKRRDVTVSAVLPRAAEIGHFHTKAYSFNAELRLLCRDLQVSYFNAWNDFTDPNHLYSSDSLHLSICGASRLGRLLNTHMKEFFRKRT